MTSSQQTNSKKAASGVRTSFTNFADYCSTLSVWLEGQKHLLVAWQHQSYDPASYHTMQTYANYHASQHFASQMGGLSATSPTPSLSANQTTAAPGPGRTIEAPEQAPPQDPDMPIQGRRYQIPNPWKRIAAEVIDYLILLVVKIIFAFIINRDLSFRQVAENIDLDLRYLSQRSTTMAGGSSSSFTSKTSKVLGGATTGFTGDMNPFELVTPEIIIAELVNRIFITIFETVCLHRGLNGRLGGATPGKRLMGLRVVSCQEVYDLPGRVEVVPGANPGIFSALIRSVIKNFAMVFFFPICMTTLFFQHHRATYDIIAGTVVVQDDPPRQNPT